MNGGSKLYLTRERDMHIKQGFPLSVLRNCASLRFMVGSQRIGLGAAARRDGARRAAAKEDSRRAATQEQARREEAFHSLSQKHGDMNCDEECIRLAMVIASAPADSPSIMTRSLLRWKHPDLNRALTQWLFVLDFEISDDSDSEAQDEVGMENCLGKKIELGGRERIEQNANFESVIDTERKTSDVSEIQDDFDAETEESLDEENRDEGVKEEKESSDRREYFNTGSTEEMTVEHERLTDDKSFDEENSGGLTEEKKSTDRREPFNARLTEEMVVEHERLTNDASGEESTLSTEESMSDHSFLSGDLSDHELDRLLDVHIMEVAEKSGPNKPNSADTGSSTTTIKLFLRVESTETPHSPFTALKSQIRAHIGEVLNVPEQQVYCHQFYEDEPGVVQIESKISGDSKLLEITIKNCRLLIPGVVFGKRRQAWICTIFRPCVISVQGLARSDYTVKEPPTHTENTLTASKCDSKKITQDPSFSCLHFLYCQDTGYEDDEYDTDDS